MTCRMCYSILTAGLFLSLFFASCRKQPVWERISLENVPTYEPVMEKLQRLRDPIGPKIYTINDSLVAITLYSQGSSYRVFNANDNSIKSGNLKKLTDSIIVADDPFLSANIEIMNRANRVFYELKVDGGVMKVNNFTLMRHGDISAYEAVKLEDNIFAGIGHYTKGLFGIINLKTNQIVFDGNYPLAGARYHDPAFVNSFTGYLDKEGDEVVYGSYNFGYLSCYQYKKGRLKKKWEKQLTNYRFTEHLNRLEIESNNEYGFQEIKMTKKHIYGLYSGYPLREMEMKNSVVVFDRKGNPLFRYNFPDLMMSIAIDPQEEYIYATYTPYMNETWIVRYRLPEWD